MSALQEVALPCLNEFNARVRPPATLELGGVIAIPDPERVLGAFFAALHHAVRVDALPEITVDLRHLTFVNSSAIRLFVAWATWLRALRPPEGYVIRFITDRRISWQCTSFCVLQSLAADAIVVDYL